MQVAMQVAIFQNFCLPDCLPCIQTNQEGEDLSELEAHWKLERLEILSPRPGQRVTKSRWIRARTCVAPNCIQIIQTFATFYGHHSYLDLFTVRVQQWRKKLRCLCEKHQNVYLNDSTWICGLGLGRFEHKVWWSKAKRSLLLLTAGPEETSGFSSVRPVCSFNSTLSTLSWWQTQRIQHRPLIFVCRAFNTSPLDPSVPATKLPSILGRWSVTFHLQTIGRMKQEKSDIDGYSMI